VKIVKCSKPETFTGDKVYENVKDSNVVPEIEKPREKIVFKKHKYFGTFLLVKIYTGIDASMSCT
jgi:hypothetical protein